MKERKPQINSAEAVREGYLAHPVRNVSMFVLALLSISSYSSSDLVNTITFFSALSLPTASIADSYFTGKEILLNRNNRRQ